MRRRILVLIAALAAMLALTTQSALAADRAHVQPPAKMKNAPAGARTMIIVPNVEMLLAATYGGCVGPDTQWASGSYTAKTKSCLAWDNINVWGRHTITCFKSALAYPCNTINRDTVDITTYGREHGSGNQYILLSQRFDWTTDIHDVDTYTFVGFPVCQGNNWDFYTVGFELNVAFANGVVGVPKSHASNVVGPFNGGC